MTLSDYYTQTSSSTVLRLMHRDNRDTAVRVGKVDSDTVVVTINPRYSADFQFTIVRKSDVYAIDWSLAGDGLCELALVIDPSIVYVKVMYI